MAASPQHVSSSRAVPPPSAPLPDQLILEFDGSCTVNPGGVAGFGWRLRAPDGRELAADGGEVCRGPGATCNVAEWGALLRGLRYLATRRWQGRLLVRGDSTLVIRQLRGCRRCKNPRLRLYRDACHALLVGIQWQATWVPRGSQCGGRRPVPLDSSSAQPWRRAGTGLHAVTTASKRFDRFHCPMLGLVLPAHGNGRRRR